MSREEIAHNFEKIATQVSGITGCEIVNNYDWTKDISIIDFLRDYGKYINVGSLSDTERTATSGDIVAKNDITAFNTIKAPALYQVVTTENKQVENKQVPFIDLVEQDDNIWQLQISRVNVKAKTKIEEEN